MKILALDDDIDFLRLLRIKVEKKGHSIQITDSPSTFLKELSESHYDVAFVDFFLPSIRDAGLLLSEIFAPYANGTKVYIVSNADKSIINKSLDHATVKISGILEKISIDHILEEVHCGI